MADVSNLTSTNELRAMLLGWAPTLGVDDRSVEHLVNTADIADWDTDGPRSASGGETPQIHLLLTGAAVFELHPAHFLQTRVHAEPSIFKILAPGEIFCVPPPGGAPFSTSARSHPDSCGIVQARAATWSESSMRELLAHFGPDGFFTLLTTSWRFLSRIAEELAVLMSLDVENRLRFVFANLSRRFPATHPDGTLIDLTLSDQFLARLVGAHRCTVNRSTLALHDSGEVQRLSDLVVVPTSGRFAPTRRSRHRKRASTATSCSTPARALLPASPLRTTPRIVPSMHLARYLKGDL